MKKSFTLIEVIIVFALIGFLSALLLPNLRTVISDDEILRAKQSYNIITTAIQTMLNTPPYDEFGSFDASNVITDTNETTDLANARKALFCARLANTLNANASNCFSRNSNFIETWVNNISASGNSYGYSNICPTEAKYAHDNDYYGYKPLCLTSKTSPSFMLDYATLSSNIDFICTEHSEDDYDMTVKGVGISVQRTNFTYNGAIAINNTSQPVEFAVICIRSKVVANDKQYNYKYGLAVRKDGKIVIGNKLQSYLDSD